MDASRRNDKGGSARRPLRGTAANSPTTARSIEEGGTAANSSIYAALRTAMKLVGPGTWGVACSGGLDSMVLAHATAELFGRQQLVVLHVDHQLQPESSTVARKLGEWCNVQSIALWQAKVKVNSGPSIEAQAREARYRALANAQRELGLPYLVTAHHAGDQAETIVMRLLRGTGPAGLCGMHPCRDGLVRPLLHLPRSVLERYAQQHQLGVWHDPMNDDERFFRVRVRKNIVPMMQQENPRISQALLSLAEQMWQWRDAIDDNMVAALPWTQTQAAAWSQPARSVAWAKHLRAAGIPVTKAAHHALQQALFASADGTWHRDIPGGTVEVRYGKIFATATGAGEPSNELAVQCAIPWRIRTRRAGDTMQPQRLRGKHRKISDLMIDAKVPRSLRATARLVVAADDDSHILWAEFIGPTWGVEISVNS
jgi:tRNA(Ile)-lysidine synthase